VFLKQAHVKLEFIQEFTIHYCIIIAKTIKSSSGADSKREISAFPPLFSVAICAGGLPCTGGLPSDPGFPYTKTVLAIPVIKSSTY
jgi:hypothetical protein